MTQKTCDTGSACGANRQSRFTPRVDISESDQELTLYADLPGVTAEGLHIGFEDGELTIEAKVPNRHPEVAMRREFSTGDFHRTFTIGDGVDVEKIEAAIKDGVLTVHLPKSESVKSRRIEVKTA